MDDTYLPLSASATGRARDLATAVLRARCCMLGALPRGWRFNVEVAEYAKVAPAEDPVVRWACATLEALAGPPLRAGLRDEMGPGRTLGPEGLRLSIRAGAWSRSLPDALHLAYLHGAVPSVTAVVAGHAVPLDPWIVWNAEADELALLDLEVAATTPELERAVGCDASRVAAPTDDVVMLGQYTLKRCLSSGGQGLLYAAEQGSPRRSVAIKVLHPHNARDRDARTRARREADCLARVDHPRVVRVHDIGLARESVWIAMDLLPGPSLGELLVRRFTSASDRPGSLDAMGGRAALAGLDERAWGEWIVQEFVGLADALDACHREGIWHRDVKPDNLVLDDEGHLVLVDFGIARDTTEAEHTTTGVQHGTRMYMAPEQLAAMAGRRVHIDGRVDVYGLGLCMCEALAGPEWSARRMAAAGGLGADVISAPPPLSLFGPWIPRRLRRVAMKSVEPDPVARYATPGDFRDDLERVGRGEGVAAGAPRFMIRYRRWRQWHPWWFLASSALVLCVVTIVAGMLVSRWARGEEAARLAALHRRTMVDRVHRMLRPGIDDAFLRWPSRDARRSGLLSLSPELLYPEVSSFLQTADRRLAEGAHPTAHQPAHAQRSHGNLLAPTSREAEESIVLALEALASAPDVEWALELAGTLESFESAPRLRSALQATRVALQAREPGHDPRPVVTSGEATSPPLPREVDPDIGLPNDTRGVGDRQPRAFTGCVEVPLGHLRLLVPIYTSPAWIPRPARSERQELHLPWRGALARTLGAQATAADWLARAVSEDDLGHVNAAMASALEALGASSAGLDLRGQAMATQLVAAGHRFRGAWPSAALAYGQCARMFREIGEAAVADGAQAYEGLCLCLAGRTSEGRTILQGLAESSNVRADAAYYLGIVAMLEGEPRAALDALGGSPEQTPMMDQLRAAARAATGDVEGALRAVEDGLARPGTPSFFTAGTAAAVLALAGRHEEAAAWSLAALELDAEYPSVWVNQGAIYYEQGRLSEAAQCFRYVTDRFPATAAAWLGLARSIESASPEMAEAALARASDLGR